MTNRSFLCAGILLATFSTHSFAQLAVYDFGSSGSPTVSASSSGANFTAGDFSIGGDASATLGTTSPASSSVGGSGSTGYRAAGDGFKPDGFTPAYFEVSLTPDSGYELSITQIDFNSYRTGTGATDWDLQYSIDGGAYTSLFTGTNASGAWTAQSSGSITLTGVTQNVTLRLFGTGASSSAGSFRIDDFSIQGSSALSAVPEPSTYAAFAGLAMLGFAAYRRRNRNRDAVALAA